MADIGCEGPRRQRRLRLGWMSEDEEIHVRRLHCSRGHALKSWSGTQATVAMSSAEAEYYALVEGAVRGLGLQSMMRELGINANVVLATDSSAAKSFSSQRGLGRMRHIEVKNLWLQEAVCRGRIKIVKISGKENPADIFTKYHGAKDLQDRCDHLNVEIKIKDL